MPSAGGQFSITGNGSADASVSVGQGHSAEFTPAECGQLAEPLRSRTAADQATSMFTHFGGSYDLTYQAAVAKTVAPIFGKFDALLSSCATFSQVTTGYAGEFTSQVTAHELTVAGVDGDYLGIALAADGDLGTKQTRILVGRERGVSFMARFADTTLRPSADANLAKIFNAQRARITQAR